jgi:bifunctional non-homologous end joining protein LigD
VGRSTGTETIHIDRVDVDLPRADKPLFPDGTSKSDLAGYYRTVARKRLARGR